VRCLGVPTRFLAHGSPDAILARLGLDAPGIAASVLALHAQLDRAALDPSAFSSASRLQGDEFP
jgi:hypothetical protein